MNYFENLTEDAAIKARYKELAKRYHPDLGGCKTTMQAINAQYKQVLTGRYQRAGKSITEIEELLKNDTALCAALNAIIHLQDLQIEICGQGLWVTGDTKTHHELLKQSGYRWSQPKLAWYWRSAEQKYYGRKSSSLDAIRGSYGSISLRNGAALLTA